MSIAVTALPSAPALSDAIVTPTPPNFQTRRISRLQT
jgi:hypothetical protein